MLHPSFPEQFSLICLFWLLFATLSNFCLDTRGEPGHSFRRPCSVLLWGGRRLQTGTACMCRECLAAYAPHGFAPAHRGVCFPGLLRACLGPAFCVLPRSKPLLFLGTLSTRAQTLLGIPSVPVRGPSSLCSQELGEHCLRGLCVLPLPGPSRRLPGGRALPQLCISSLGS